MVVCVPAIRLAAVRVLVRESVHAADTVVFEAGGAFFTIGFEARRILGADAYAVANFDVFGGVGADADGFADDFMADADGWVENVSPPKLKAEVQVGRKSSRYGVGPHPLLSVWISLPQMPQCVISISISVSSQVLGLGNCCQTILP